MDASLQVVSSNAQVDAIKGSVLISFFTFRDSGHQLP